MANKYLRKFRCANHSDEPPKAKIVSAMASTIFESHLHCTTIEFEQIFGCHFPVYPKLISCVPFFWKTEVVNSPFFCLRIYSFVIELYSGARRHRLRRILRGLILMGLGLFPLRDRRRRLACLFFRQFPGR